MIFEQELGNVPDIVARPGESWERTEISDIGSGQTLHFQKKYEYIGTEKKGDKTFDKIRGTATKVELKQDAAVNAQLKVLKGDLTVESSDETILFDRDLGRVESARLEGTDQGRQNDLLGQRHGAGRRARPDDRDHHGAATRAQVSRRGAARGPFPRGSELTRELSNAARFVPSGSVGTRFCFWAREW